MKAIDEELNTMKVVVKDVNLHKFISQTQANEVVAE